MPEVRIVHDFACDAGTFWDRLFFDDEYNRRLFLDALRFPVWRVVSQAKTDAGVTRRIDIQPLVEHVPGPIKRLLGDRFGYSEQVTFDRASGRYRFTITPSVMPDKIRIEGQLYLAPAGPKKTRRVVETRVEVKVFAVGRMIEEKTIADMKASYEKAAAFTNEFLNEKGL